MATSDVKVQERARRIAGRSRGEFIADGAIARVLGPWEDRASPETPSKLVEMLKPFLFLDLINTVGTPFSGMAMHPHSGLATVTYIMQGSISYEDTTGATGILPAGGVEYFRAGRGAWHGGGLGEDGRARGYQLWVALPPEQELSEVESVYLPADVIPQVGPVTVVLGEYGGATSPVKAPPSLTYLAIRLKAGEQWRYQPPADHTVCWVGIGKGNLLAPERLEQGEIIAFEASNAAVTFTAEVDSEFVLGSAVKHPYELALGRYSVHTSKDALQKGEANIAAIKERLIAEGRTNLV